MMYHLYSGMISLRRLTVFLCLVAVLLAAINPSAPGVLSACLVTLFFFVAAVVIVPLPRQYESNCLPVTPLVAIIAPRAPPGA